jgi:hypothetical protein
MFKNTLLALLVLAAASASAAPPMFVRYETPVETTVSMTSMPTQVPDTIVARGCASCEGLVLNVTAATKFFVNQEPVDLTELRRQAVGDLFVGIYYIEETNVVTRIVLANP